MVVGEDEIEADGVVGLPHSGLAIRAIPAVHLAVPAGRRGRETKGERGESENEAAVSSITLRHCLRTS